MRIPWFRRFQRRSLPRSVIRGIVPSKNDLIHFSPTQAEWLASRGLELWTELGDEAGQAAR